jgi:uncharacterized protein with von Willebrand factor type A (vWA) domain
MPSEVTIVVDISGRVATNYVERVINAIVDTNSGIDLKNSHIIFCDTEVTSDEIISKRTRMAVAGGGTDIAVGIAYAGRYMKKSTSKLFCISDFEDNISAWVREAKKFPGQKYAIGYNVSNSDNFNGVDVVDRYIGSSSNAQDFLKTFKVLFINEKIE